MKRFYRKLQKFRETFYVSLPKSWTRKFQLTKSSPIAIDIRSDGCLIINPNIREEGHVDEEIILQASKTIPKDIVKNSLIGIDRIIIVSEKQIEKEIVKDIKLFIKRLPNTEIIEESPQRIEVRNFDMENIPTYQVVKRLLFLVRDMFENIREYQLNELESNFAQLRKFYYILVAHIRTYLRTGVYISEDSDFTPLEAMDIRMLCQRIEKIGEILLNLDFSEEIKEFFQKTEIYYIEVMEAFLKTDTESAYALWFKRDNLIEEAKKITNNLSSNDVDRIKDIVMIAHNCKDMAALI